MVGLSMIDFVAVIVFKFYFGVDGIFTVIDVAASWSLS